MKSCWRHRCSKAAVRRISCVFNAIQVQGNMSRLTKNYAEMALCERNSLCSVHSQSNPVREVPVFWGCFHLPLWLETQTPAPFQETQWCLHQALSEFQCSKYYGMRIGYDSLPILMAVSAVHVALLEHISSWCSVLQVQGNVPCLLKNYAEMALCESNSPCPVHSKNSPFPEVPVFWGCFRLLLRLETQTPAPFQETQWCLHQALSETRFNIMAYVIGCDTVRIPLKVSAVHIAWVCTYRNPGVMGWD